MEERIEELEKNIELISKTFKELEKTVSLLHEKLANSLAPLSVVQFAYLTGLKPDTVRKKCKTGEIPHQRLTGPEGRITIDPVHVSFFTKKSKGNGLSN
jgi:hypothetical protein